MAILFALLAGLTDSIKNVLAKKDTKEYAESTINFAWMLFATLLTLPLALFYIPDRVSNTFILVLIAVTFFDFFGYMLYLKSIKYTDLSLSLPMLALTPVFVLLISFVTLDQKVSGLALLGIGFIILGGYLLNLKKDQQQLLDPFKQIFINKGIRFMLLASILWGFANSLHKVGISETNSFFYLGVNYLCLTLAFLAQLLYEKPKELALLKNWKDFRTLAPVGILEGATTLFQYLSQDLIASSVITVSLKRSSIVFSAILGHIFFKEKIKERMLPIGLVIVGIVLLAM